MRIFWSGFAVFCMVHLVACYSENVPIRKATKIFIVPLLMLGLFISRTDNTLLLTGLLLGWIGDLFLLSTKKPLFICGAAAFALGHFAYIGAILQDFFRQNGLRDIPIAVDLALLCVAAVLFLVAHFAFKKKLGGMAYVGAGYFSVLISAAALSFMAGNYMMTAGFAVFICSDCLIALCRFFKKVRRDHFYVMSTYILAQTLICMSFI